MRQQQQEMSMNSNIMAMQGIVPGRELQVVSAGRRSKERRLPNRDRYFDGLDDG